MSPTEQAPRGDLRETIGKRTTRARPASIAEAFTRNAQRAPEKLCLRFEGEDWYYGRLRERAGAFAAALRTWGLKPGERVALFLRNHPDFLAAYLGTHLAGGVVMPVNKGYRRTELRHIFGDAGVRLCFTDGKGGRSSSACGRKEMVERSGGRSRTSAGRSSRATWEPRPVVFVDALPRNALGKVLKYRVREGLIELEE
jgi:acyl-CoA synthetase (AMP-forming)/AMP-acid ligase II